MDIGLQYTKVLGCQIDLSTDSFCFAKLESKDHENFESMIAAIADKENKLTKRLLASIMLKFTFDPLGLIGEFVFKVKMLIRRTHQLSPDDWDEFIDELPGGQEIVDEFLQVMSEYPSLQNLVFPRTISLNKRLLFKNIIGFSDASRDCYGAAIYIQHIYESLDQPDGRIAMSLLLCTKSRLAPLTETRTINSLELLSIFLAVRVVTHIVQKMALP